MIARPHDGLALCGSFARDLVGAIARPHVGLTPVRQRLPCPLSWLEIRAEVPAVQPLSLASQS
eukprot:811149-Prymnesium_polylepis.1